MSAETSVLADDIEVLELYYSGDYSKCLQLGADYANNPGNGHVFYSKLAETSKGQNKGFGILQRCVEQGC